MEVLTMNYYWISINNNSVSTVAYAPKGIPASHDLITEVEEKKALPFSLKLYNVAVNEKLVKGGLSDIFYDYQPNSLAWPLMSERMKSIIVSHLTGLELIEWKEVTIEGYSTSKLYYIPFFLSKLDTLNKAESIVIPSSGIVLKPCFKREEVEKYAVFHGYSKFWKITTQIYINEDIKKELIESNLKELSFSRINIK